MLEKKSLRIENTFALVLTWLAMNRIRIRISFKRFTPSNTGLDVASQYPEMASTFKAAFLKSALWFYAKKALEIAEKYPSDT